MPSLWNGYDYDGEELQGTGYSTLRLVADVDTDNELLALRVGRIETAYDLYINGKLIHSNGKIAKNKEDAEPFWNATNINFIADSIQLEIIFHISNYHHKKGGFSGNIIIGDDYYLHKYASKLNYKNVFLIGILLIIGLYHFGLFILRTKDKSSLFFSIVCLSVAFITLFFGDVLVAKILPDFRWEILVKLLYLSYYFGVISLLLFISYTFREYFHKPIIISAVILQGLLALATLVTPVKIFTNFMIPFEISTLLIFIYLLIFLFVATIKKEKGAFFSLLALFLFLAAITNDILFDNLIIKSIYLLPVGIFFFVLLQAFTLSLRFSRLFKANEQLTTDLNDINTHLEDTVKERTAEVVQQKEELLVQSENLLQINEELKVQSEILEDANIKITLKNGYPRKVGQ